MTDSIRSIALIALGLGCSLGCGRFDAPGSTAGAGPPVVGDQGGAGHASVGLISAVPDGTRVRVEWRAEGLQDPAPAVALFHANDPDMVFDGAGLPLDLEQAATLVEGLPTGEERWFGLAVDQGGGFVPSGPLLRVRTAAPIHVDPQAPAGGDGSAQSPFNALWPAILTAFVQGGGNVWVAQGLLEDVSVGLLDGVDLYGGFPSDFDLTARDPVEQVTLLRAKGNSTLIALEASDVRAVIDGLSFDGGGTSAAGVDVDSHPVELRRLTISGCSRALKLRSAPNGDEIPVQIVRCTLADSGVEGLSVDGAFQLLIEDCSFVSNGQEGIDMDDLYAPSGGKARLTVRDCRFAHNGADGLDVDLGVAASGPGGEFVIRIEDCEFEHNGGVGLLVDHDFEAFPDWYARVILRGCVARANGDAGLHLDLDGPGQAHLHRVRADANQGDGLLVSSESRTGTVVISSSAFIGNHGYGVRGSQGFYGLLLSHCALAGNRLGGLDGGPGRGLAVSSVAYLQASPWEDSQGHFSVDTDAPQTFLRAPTQYHRVTGVDQGALVLGSSPGFGVGTTVEVAEDGVQRSASVVNGNRVTVTPKVTVTVKPPSVLASFDSAGPVAEDWTLPAGSPATGAGMPAPGGPAVDAGPLGTPLGGTPGREDLLPPALFTLSGTSPPWNQVLQPDTELVLSFQGGAPDGASLPTGIDAVDADGAPLPIDPWVDGDTLRVPAPPGGWPNGALLRLHAGLTDENGTPLSAPLALPLDVQ